MKQMRLFFGKLLSLKQGEFRLLALSFGFIFVLFSSYALLRPMRDALGLEGGKDELKWLFLATFASCIIASLVLMWLSTRIRRRFYTDFVFVFFALNLIGFFVAMNAFETKSVEFVWLARAFYVWVSIFNLFAFSFVGFTLIAKSPYLLALCAFVLLLTSVSTFLYMEQARIVRETFATREARMAAFANIDLVVQISALIIQIFLTAKIAQFFKLTALLGMLGFVICAGFVVLIFTHPAFLPLAVVMSVRRVGEYALVKPGREMLFVPLSSDEKYKVKSFIDTVIYRGGDALWAQFESLLASVSITLVLGVGAFVSFVWGLLGVFLGKRYEKTT